MKRCLAYIRVSTTKQGERSSSLQEQRAAIEAYALRHRITIAEWFVEIETAATQGRREFNRVVAELRRGRADALIVHKIDRSARNLKDWAAINDLMDIGIAIHFAHESLDLGTRGGRLAADIQAVVAADYIRNLKDEVRKGFYGRLKQGFYPLPAPRGYRDNGAAKAKTVDPVAGPLVKKAFELYAGGQYGLEDLRKMLAHMGLRASSGAPLSAASLANMLHNPFYVGLIRISTTGEMFEGCHEPLISKAVFDQVQDRMSGRVFSRPTRHSFAFRRFIKCRCGRTLTGEHQKGHTYYRCHTRACRGTSVAEEALEELAAQILYDLRWDDGDVGDFKDIVAELIEQDRSAAKTRREHIRREMQLVAGKLERLGDLLVDGTIERDLYTDRREALLMRKHELNERLEEEDDTFWRTVLEMFELGNMAYLQYLTANDEKKREILFSICSNSECDGKNVAFKLRFPFEQLRNYRISSIGGPSSSQVRKRTRVRRDEIRGLLVNLRMNAHDSSHENKTATEPRDYA